MIGSNCCCFLFCFVFCIQRLQDILGVRLTQWYDAFSSLESSFPFPSGLMDQAYSEYTKIKINSLYLIFKHFLSCIRYCVRFFCFIISLTLIIIL